MRWGWEYRGSVFMQLFKCSRSSNRCTHNAYSSCSWLGWCNGISWISCCAYNRTGGHGEEHSAVQGPAPPP